MSVTSSFDGKRGRMDDEYQSCVISWGQLVVKGSVSALKAGAQD